MENSVTTDIDERHRVDATLRHKLAMECIGLVRTALHMQRPVLTALIDGARSGDGGLFAELSKANLKSFELQIRMAKASLRFLEELDALADEALTMVEKEKINA